MIEAYFDGVCEPTNPKGHGAYGVYISNGQVLLNEGIYVGHGEGISNNVAEYSGFIHILEVLKTRRLNDKRIIIRGDSKLVIEQMAGRWRIKQGFYVPFALKAEKILESFKNIVLLQWIPREENEICDKLAKDVLRNMKISFKIQPEPNS
jgi:probable phosphoglycerate mutase